MSPATEQRQRGERLVSLAASLQAVTQVPRPRRRLRLHWPWFVVIGCALVLASFPFIRGFRPVDLLVRRWQVQSHLLSDTAVAARVRELPALGEDGLPLLVQALTDTRPVVSEAAHETLVLEVANWKELPLVDASRRVSKLLQLLRASCASISPLVGDDVRSIVLELLRWPVDSNAVDSADLVANCEYVLARLYRWPEDSVARDSIVDDSESEMTAAEESEASELPELTNLEDIDENETQVAQNSGAGASVSISDDSAAEGASTTDEIAVTGSQSPKLMEASTVVSRSPVGMSIEESTDSELTELDLIELGQRLGDSSAEVVMNAVDELERRGFRSDHITIIEQLFDAEPRIRKAALDELPRISGFDSRPWLWHLAEDDDSDVRRTAVALMRTSVDPATRRKLRELEMK